MLQLYYYILIETTVMHKTTHAFEQTKRKPPATQNAFYKRRQQSPLKSQKSFDSASIRTELMLSKNYGRVRAMQVSLRPTGAYTT